ncbi:hypothetical protein WG66_002963 [Moniliophthora roreri]|nr:hypothetical protein WG66_002963 [Moniliophthora roreri]
MSPRAVSDDFYVASVPCYSPVSTTALALSWLSIPLNLESAQLDGSGEMTRGSTPDSVEGSIWEPELRFGN